MSEKIIGRLDRKERVNKNGKSYYIVEVGGQKFSAWEISREFPGAFKEVEGCREGEIVELEWAASRKDPRFKNVARIAIRSSQTPEPDRARQSGSDEGGPGDEKARPTDKDMSISRLSEGGHSAVIVGGLLHALSGMDRADMESLLSWAEENAQRIADLQAAITSRLYQRHVFEIYGEE